jgi:ornithine cyclodeaminase/alanine dehydrogenase-like protein (mu-crystallin family)
MPLILSESDVRELLDMRSAISCIETAFEEQSKKRFLLPERQVFKSTDSAVVRFMAASLPQLNTLGLKVLLGVPAKRKIDSTYFLVLLLSPEDASLLAIISAGRLTQLRTGAASAVATRHLAKRGFDSVGILGAGVQGYAQLEAMVAATGNLKDVVIYDMDASRSQAIGEKAKSEFGVKTRVASLIDELYDKDVICTATTTVKPLLFGNKLHEGTHVNAIGSNAPTRQEIDHTVLLKSRVFTDKTEQVLQEAGDLVIPISQGLYKSDNIIGEIGDVITGKIAGRNSNSDITLFKSVGIALEDVAVARIIYDLAVQKGLGQEISF